jgi:predicted Abi (CAAX) family protease
LCLNISIDQITIGHEQLLSAARNNPLVTTLLSTIFLRLGLTITILPTASQVLMGWLLLFGYCSIAIPFAFKFGLANLESIQVWWNLQLYVYGLRLRNNRRALLLLISLVVWLAIEEILLRVAIIPLSWEQLTPRSWWLCLLLSWSLATLKYPLFYGQFNNLFQRPSSWVLGALLELFCTLVYVSSNSFWLTLWVHWSIVALWLLPLGGKYLLWCHKKIPSKINKNLVKEKNRHPKQTYG